MGKGVKTREVVLQQELGLPGTTWWCLAESDGVLEARREWELLKWMGGIKLEKPCWGEGQGC